MKKPSIKTLLKIARTEKPKSGVTKNVRKDVEKKKSLQALKLTGKTVYAWNEVTDAIKIIKLFVTESFLDFLKNYRWLCNHFKQNFF